MSISSTSSDYKSARQTESSSISSFDQDHKQQLTVDEALARVGHGKFQRIVMFIAGLAFSSDAVELTLLTFLSPCVQESWTLSGVEAASLASVVFGGAICGSVVLGTAADLYGRKSVYLVSCSLTFFFGVASCFSLNFNSLLFTRAMVGVGIGGITAPFNLLAEILHPDERAKYLLYIEYYWTMGSFYTTLAAYIMLESLGWRVLAGICAIPVFLSLLAGCYLPESPRWLLLNNRPKEAKEVIMKIASVNKSLDNLPIEWELQLGSIQKIDVNLISFLKPLELLGSYELRKTTALVWIVWLAFGLTYFGVILLISRVFGVGDDDDDDDDDVDDDKETAKCAFHSLSVLVSSTSEILGVTAVLFIINSAGRKGSQFGLLLIGALATLIVGVVKSDILLTIFAFLARGSIMGASAATWVAIPELYPTNLRTTGHSMATIVARCGAFASPYIVDSSLSILTLGVIFAIMNILSCIALLILPETSGKSLDEDDELMHEASMFSASALSFYRNTIGSFDSTTFNPLPEEGVSGVVVEGTDSTVNETKEVAVATKRQSLGPERHVQFDE